MYPELNYTCRDNVVDQAVDIITFAQARPSGTTDRTRLKHFYEQMTTISVMPCLCCPSDNLYSIINSREAVAWYFVQLGPKAWTPRKTMNALSEFAKQVLSEFSESNGNIITVSRLESALRYTEGRYHFFQKVFAEKRPVFAIINNTNKTNNAHCYIGDSPRTSQTSIFLYAATGISPEAVLFHELGHCLHLCLTGNPNEIPDGTLDYLAHYGFKSLATATTDEQREVLADVLSIGMMYDSPYADDDPFTLIADEDKKAYHELVKYLLNRIPE